MKGLIMLVVIIFVVATFPTESTTIAKGLWILIAGIGGVVWLKLKGLSLFA